MGGFGDQEIYETDMNKPRFLFDAWDEVRAQVQDAKRLALFTDFDGTLVRIRRRPEDVELHARVRDLLIRISRTGALVGVVSGRMLNDVRAKVGIQGIWYVGSHGFFILDPSNRTKALISPSQRKRTWHAYQFLRKQLDSADGIRVTWKDSTVAVHYRCAPQKERTVARKIIGQVLRKEPRLQLLAGKKIWEILPDSQVDKWSAIRAILAQTRKHNPKRNRHVFYLGDDTTDERVFEKMRGLSVAVGKCQRTSARFFLHTPGEVHQFLKRLSAEL